jgi:dTDP-4-amino-4,6-dideoxygalactose transaminase
MVPIHKVFMPENIESELSEILYSGQLAYGKFSKIFEEQIRRFICNDLTIAISGNSILFALQLLGIRQGDEIIASPMSCLMTTQPVAMCNAKIVWADVDPQTGTLDPEDVLRKITNRTKAIIHYHWAGYPGYIDEINDIGKINGIPIIEEASMAFGSQYKNKKIGNTGSDIVCFSFGPVRLPNAIDGAGLSFNNSMLFKKALRFRDLGVNRTNFRDEHGEISELSDVAERGGAYTLNNVSGFIGLKQMECIETLLNKQFRNAVNWRKEFINENDLTLLDARAEIKPNYWVYSLVFDRERDKKLAMYRKREIYASKLHFRNDHYSVFKKNKSREFLLKGVEKFSRNQLCLPCGWWL